MVMVVQSSGPILDGLSIMIEKGDVRPVVEGTYGWDELAEAHRRVETGRVTGRLAVA
jgi:NADPH:quinone reductase-like Zn-dependent oxidoreductase